MRYVIMPCIAATLFMLTACSGSNDNSVNLSTSNAYPLSTIYSCDDGTDFIADFASNQVTLTIAAGPIVTLQQQRAASGILYSTAGYELRGKGNSASLRQPKRKPANCSGL